MMEMRIGTDGWGVSLDDATSKQVFMELVTLYNRMARQEQMDDYCIMEALQETMGHFQIRRQ